MSFWEVFFLFLIYIPLLIMWGVSLVDIFMRPDLSGGAKALWVIGLFVFPWVGLLVYVLTRPPTVPGAFTTRGVQEPTTIVAQPTSTVAQQLEQLARLQSQGVLTETEFAAAKSRVLAESQPGTKAA